MADKTDPLLAPPGPGSQAAAGDGSAGGRGADDAGRPPEPPSISLPKGGGAIRGLGEKFAVNTSTGTAAFSVPLPISPGRDGMQPQLALSYDSGAGNGPFGIGWVLGTAAITCKTDKGLPRYIESGPDADVYVLSGAEDLVPVLDADAGWSHPAPTRTLPNGSKWVVERFRPRIERLFARIERWTPYGGGAAHWRSITKDGVTSLYGTSDESRVTDPSDGARVFSWLLCETYDQKGNAMLFRYVAEDSERVDAGLAHERNRTPASRGAGRYLKRVLYGNATPRADGEELTARTDWLFELVLDYGEHDENVPRSGDNGTWSIRDDPFSTYRSRFDVRTYRLCKRILMFHQFPNEPGVEADCLVRSLELGYDGSPVATKLVSIVQSGHRRQGAGYLTRSFPPVELEYSEPRLNSEIHEVDAENLPQGIGGLYRLVDLDGEGLPGILTEQGGAWHYKRNVSPLTRPTGAGGSWTAAFAPLETEPDRPSISDLAGGRQQLMDVDGDGRIELAQLGRPLSGYHSRTDDGSWEPFQPFASMPNRDWESPNVRFTDLTGDGHADAILTEDRALQWYPSLAGLGFGEEERSPQPFDEERGPRLVFADGTKSVYVADLSGDGLGDLVRVRNGEVCYWPNIGYGTFGAKVTMDNSPVFDTEEAFDQRRVRLADVDGSGPADLVYIGASGLQLYANQTGNAFADAQVLDVLPDLADPAGIAVADLLGNGTSCLVWSSALPGNTMAPLRYADLMGGTKPHLLMRVANNLGAETVIGYTASTKFYVKDRAAGRPWITRLAFPVQVVERVETYDRVSHNRFVTSYAYHHGYFDSAEREFRGFGCVDQFDTEEFAALTADGTLPAANLDLGSHVPPVRTTTWFHTGAHLDGARISKQLEHEYYREGDGTDGLTGLTDVQVASMELADTVLPDSILKPDGHRQSYDLLPDEQREACRALKGSVLRQEVYGLDGTDAEDRPYRVSERNYTVELLQPQQAEQHAVFLPHAREVVQLQYERTLFVVDGQMLADPRVTHSFTLAADVFGNVLRSASVGYGRRHEDSAAHLTAEDRTRQASPLVTYVELGYTNSIDHDDSYRVPQLCESTTYELLKVFPTPVAGVTSLFGFDELIEATEEAADGLHDVPVEDVDAAMARAAHPYRRLVQQARTLFRRDDLTGPLPFGTIQPRALQHEGYRLALTQGLIDSAFVRARNDGTTEDLITHSAATLGTDGGYVRSGDLRTAGLFPADDPDDYWWMPAGRFFLSPDAADDAAAESAYAQAHFYVPYRFQDPFGNVSTVLRDRYAMLLLETRDPLGNTVTAGTRQANGTIVNRNDYRVLEPAFVTDPNGNMTTILFDARGYVTATALMGTAGQGEGDSLTGLEPDVDDAVLASHLDDPLDDPHSLLGDATTRLVYDVQAYTRTRDDAAPLPVVAYALERETHAADMAPGVLTRVQHRLVYSDGFGRELQRKSQAEPNEHGEPRWIGSGWHVYDNKGKVVREYEPFFSPSHRFELANKIGVSRIRFYDAAGRLVAVLHPDHTWEKITIDPWSAQRWDVNDTVGVSDPSVDADVGPLLARLDSGEYLPTWYQARSGGALGSDEQTAARQAAEHQDTPTRVYVDPLGREFLTVTHNRFRDSGATVDAMYRALLRVDIAGNHREIVDAAGRLSQQSTFDLARVRIRDDSMEAGTRWVLNDVTGKHIRNWDSRGHTIRSTYDALRRPLEVRVRDLDGTETLISRLVYGESQGHAEDQNLRGRVYQSSDGAGRLTTAPYDFKGNLLRSARQLAAGYRSTLDWSHAVPFENGEMTVVTTFDAQNRPVTRTTPDGAVVTSRYNAAGLLDGVSATISGAASTSAFVRNVDYNARGQRVSVAYANGVAALYTYDRLSFRLLKFVASRGNAYPNDCPNPGVPPCGLQNLNYTYDPAGNVISIRDDAQPTIFFRGRRVEARADYIYDAVYRLVAATGREHLGQVGAAPQPTSATDAPRVGVAHPSDAGAMGRYAETYGYDAVGNILVLAHDRADPQAGGWSRRFTYAVPSALEAAAVSNRLSSIRDSGGPAQPLSYDEQGNTLSLPALPTIEWDHADRVCATSTQIVANGGTPERTYYVYDANGSRVRKVTDRQTGPGADPTRRKERVYIAGFEVYREFDGSGDLVMLERETMYIGDDDGRVAAVETRTVGADASPAQLIRYQLADHLHSSLLELASDAAVISYEEYYPYGGTAYQAVRSQTEAPKRYRFSGKERDEESGLYFYGSRYYCSWLGRWTSCDPAENADGPNRYLYVRANPIRLTDPNGRQTSEPPARAEIEAQRSDPALHDTAVCRSVNPSDLVCSRTTSTPVATPTPGGTCSLSATGPPTGDHDSDSSNTTNVGGAGYGLMYSTPVRFTLSVPNSYDLTKMQAYQRGVLRGEIGRNAGAGNSTSVRRNAPVQRQARIEQAAADPMPTDTAPGGRGWAQDHIVELQHDLTGESGNNAGDYRWQDSALNSAEGSQSWALQQNNTMAEPAGAVVRAGEAGRWYNSVEARGVGNALGTGLMLYGVYQSTTHVATAVQADIHQGTAGAQTARAVAHEAAGWAGALAGAEAAAPWGAACGPVAWICVPAFGLVGGGVGYWAASTTADTAIDVGQELTR